MRTSASPRTGCWDSGACVTPPTCDDSFGMSPAPLTALSSTYPLWQNLVDDLLHFSSTSYSGSSISSSTCLSRPCLIAWRVMANPPCCEDRSRTHGACNPSRARPHASTSGLIAFPLRPLPPRATVYRHRILQAIEHPYRRMCAPSRRWPSANFVGSPTPTP